MMVQHAFVFESVALAKPPLSSCWRVTLATADSVEILATLDFIPAMEAWRLCPCPPLPREEASWSHSAYPASSRPRTVPAWLQREVIAQLAAWSIGKLLGREPSHAREGDRESPS